MLLRRFPIPPQHHWFPWAAQASTRMSRIPRLAGYGFMAAAALLAAVMKKEGAQTVGPLPAVVVALFPGLGGDRESGGAGKRGAVRVDSGGCGVIKQTKTLK